MRSLFVPLRLATDARGLEFITDLDRNIDRVARRALSEARGESQDAIARYMVENAEEDGIVVGDETRLRQIITNLARWVETVLRISVVAELNLLQQRVQVYAGRWQADDHDQARDSEPPASRRRERA